MSLNLQCKPKIFIKNQDVNVESFDINFQGKNRINSCNLKINHNLVDWSRLFNEEVKIYLNENDGKPIFRGFIKQVVPSDTNLNITVYDPRYLLTSKEGTEESNFSFCIINCAFVPSSTTSIIYPTKLSISVSSILFSSALCTIEYKSS